jgi:mannose-6-phosphate isomerase-like protein (cupin superfamily)
MTIVIVGKLEPEHIQIGPLQVIFYGHREHTSGHADVYEVVIPEGARVPGAHHHVDVDEVIAVLEGTITYRIGDEKLELRAGECAFSPKGIPHHFANNQSGTARMIITATPGRMGPEYFREVAALVRAGVPPDLARVKAVINKYGLEPVPMAGL